MAFNDVWHFSANKSYDEEEDDVEGNEELMLTTHREDDNARLLDYTVLNRNPHQNVAHSTAYHRARDERKYKYSLVSILVIGVILLMTINIGLGLHKCESQVADSSSTSTPAKSSLCVDKKTGIVFPWQSYRLPTKISPQYYHIFLHPNFTAKTCQGEVTIDIQALQTTNIVVLHVGVNVVLGHVTLSSIDKPGDKIAPKQTLHCIANEVVAFIFGEPLSGGKAYQLSIKFSYDFTSTLFGFYLSHYKKPDGSQMMIGTTQMEPSYARRAFPCFDEPSFKANFSLSMVRERKYFTLFNMPLKSSRDYGNGLEIDEFETSVHMSSYLVAFLVSDFGSITKSTKSGMTVNLYASPGKTTQLQFALDIAIESLNFYEELFKIPFPLPKMDLVAIPDFDSGAMENWGLLMFRETSLLYNPSTASVANQEWIATTVAHEISHQWFGNLVTMEWWDDLWLNEGFATFMEYYAVGKIHPEWKVLNEIPSKVLIPAMAVDVSRYTHAITFEVNSLVLIEAMFDNISYEKGGSLITMLANYFGESFYDGLRAYLKKFAYSNASSKDLVGAIAEASPNSNVNVQAMMKTWTTQPGFPIVHVSLTSGGKILLRQERFLYKSDDPAIVATGDTVWQVPLVYVTDSQPTTAQQYFLKDRTVTISASFTSWIKFNHNEAGYFLVSYDTTLWKGLSDQLQKKPSVFTAIDRMSILHHAFISAQVGYLSYAELFTMMDFVRTENEYIVISSAIGGLKFMSSILEHQMDQSVLKKLQSFSNYLLQPTYEKVAWKDKTTLDNDGAKLQSIVTSTMCMNGYQPCVDEALRRFAAWRFNNTAISPDLQLAVLKTAILYGPVANWDFIWNYYLGTTDAVLKVRFVAVLATTKNPEKIVFLQREALAGVTIRSQNLNYAIGPMFTTFVGSTLTWNFIRDKWSQLIQITPVSGETMRYIIKETAAAFNDKSEIISATNFYKSQGVSKLKFVEEALETAWIRLYWVEHRLPEVTTWLNAGKWLSKP